MKTNQNPKLKTKTEEGNKLQNYSPMNMNNKRHNDIMVDIPDIPLKNKHVKIKLAIHLHDIVKYNISAKYEHIQQFHISQRFPKKTK